MADFMAIALSHRSLSPGMRRARSLEHRQPARGELSIVLSRSGAADYNHIQAMFLFDSFQLYGIIGAAVVFAAAGLWVIRRAGRTAGGQLTAIERKVLHRGNAVGGFLFGVAGRWPACGPGPILVNIGEGKIYAAAALAGAGAYGALYERLQNAFGLPPLNVGTGEG